MISLLLSFSLLMAHDFHVSKAQVEYNSREEALQITLHIFLDDLELALEKQGHTKLFLCTEKEALVGDSLVAGYLTRQFELWVDGKKVEPYYLGKEISDDLAAAWCYMEVSEVKAISELRVRNAILMDLYADQKNILSVTEDRKDKGYYMLQKGDAVRDTPW